MRLFLCILAVIALALFCVRVQKALGFPPEARRQSLHLLADSGTRQAAFRVFLRGDLEPTLRVLEPYLSLAPGEAGSPPAELRQVYAQLYIQALAGLAPDGRGPEGEVRSTLTTLLGEFGDEDPADGLLYEAILARLGRALDFPAEPPSQRQSAPSSAELQALPYWLASTGDPRAPGEILALQRFWPPLAPRASLAPRLHAARALHSLGSPAGIDVLVSALSNAKTRTQRHEVEAELRQLTGAAIAGNATAWQEWWAPRRGALEAGGAVGSGPWFSINASTLVVVVFCLIVYFIIAWVRSITRWNNGWGMLALTTAIYLVLRELIGNHVAASGLPYTPYGLRSAAYLVDTVLLPYHVILFTLLAAFAPRKKARKPA